MPAGFAFHQCCAAQRRLLLETSNGTPPTLGGATLVRSEAGRHEYTFDATQTKIAALLEQAAGQTQVLDVETHRAPIDEVVADLYQHWLAASPVPPADGSAPTIDAPTPTIDHTHESPMDTLTPASEHTHEPPPSR